MTDALYNLSVFSENQEAKTPIRATNNTVCTTRMAASSESEEGGALMVHIRFDRDVSQLFPYINAEIAHARLSENPATMRIFFKDRHCVLYPDHCFASPFSDRARTRLFEAQLIGMLNDIQYRKDQIVPNYRIFEPTSVVEILRLLPKNNCGKCGFNSCMAFAALLGQQQTDPNRCPHLGFPMAEQAVYPVYDNDGNLKSTVTIGIGSNQKQQGNDGSRPDIRSNRMKPLSNDKKRVENSGNKALPTPLTDREIEVLEMVAQGATNPEIADCLYISPHTVKSHVIHIFNKLGVGDRTQAAVWAIRHNLV